ncbi:MAG: P-type conjugative transfer protein TrbG [Rhodomicrobium sp.]|nr:P-type conjugative transfer protein TrbG [Rhodomicrobium sp.]
MRRVIVFALSAWFCAGAQAQTSGLKDVPDSPPPSVPLFTGPQPPLAPKEAKGVAYGKEWARNRAGPARGEEGATIFVFGSTLPTIVCAPLYVCDLALQEGESVNDLNVGDSVRWKITPAAQGAGDAIVTHVIIKPTDVGLVTNLVITTNRRTYIIKLLSRAQDWMPRAAFEYPDDANSQWKAYRARFEAKQEMQAARAAAPAPAKLDFEYSISGDAPWKPTRVYTDGVKTYILFPPEVGSTELPALVEIAEDNSFLGLDSLINGPATHLVNYRFTDHRFEADKVLTNAKLTSGVGQNAVTVTINREKRD